MHWSSKYDASVSESSTPIGWVRHLKVKRLDGLDDIGWNDLQTIKNEVLGDDVLAIEFYPPLIDVVDECNVRHLWEIPPHLLPFGLHIR